MMKNKRSRQTQARGVSEKPHTRPPSSTERGRQREGEREAQLGDGNSGATPATVRLLEAETELGRLEERETRQGEWKKRHHIQGLGQR